MASVSSGRSRSLAPQGAAGAGPEAAAHVVGTSAPPSGERLRPLLNRVGSGAIRPATSPCPIVNVGASSSSWRGTCEKVRASRSIAADELTFMSTRFSHCARTSGWSLSGRWVARKRYRPYLRPSAAIRTACSMANACV